MHSNLAVPTEPQGEITVARLVQLVVGAIPWAAAWAAAWAASWIWVWPIAVIATTAISLVLGVLATAVVVLADTPPDVMHSSVKALVSIIAIWTVVMNVLGAGAAMSLKTNFRPNRAFQILLGTASAGLGAGLILGLMRYWLAKSI
ncbi:MAG: hypothetical protein ACFB12_19930 [Leptolyngbyaceae cyanobacterium]